MRDKQEYKRIWKKHHGTIPYGYHIHHIDGNPTNNNINNNINIVGFEDMKCAIDKNYNIITTISNKNISNLIKNTINPNEEELYINDMIDNNRFNENIIIYGKNNCDNNTYLKYKDLINVIFGFIFLLPVAFVVGFYSIELINMSWKIQETSTEAGGLPYVFVQKTFILLFPLTLCAAFFNQLIKTIWK